MKHNIVLLETVAVEAYNILKANSNINVLEGYTPETLNTVLANNDIHGVISRGKGQVNKGLFERCPNLKVAARCGIGLDNFEIEEATKRNIQVINAPGVNAATVAEHTILLMLLLQRNVFNQFREVKNDNWQSRNSFEGDDYTGKTLGILGLGNIGSKVAKIATAMGIKVVYWGKQVINQPYPFYLFEEIIKECDVISIHLPLIEETKHMFNAEAFSGMKKNAILINTARAGIIDQEALENALKEKQIAGFGADVFDLTKNESILSLDNVLVSPHIASLTKTTYTTMCVQTVNNAIKFLNKENVDKVCLAN